MKRFLLATVIAVISLALVSPGLSTWALGGGGGGGTVGGDVSGDGTRSISDAVYLLRFLFSRGPAPVEPQEPDASPELVEAIQAAATKLLERMPPEEERGSLGPFEAALTDIIWIRDLGGIRDQTRWTQGEADAAAAAVVHDIELYSISHVYSTIVGFGLGPESRYTRCLDQCYPAYLECRNRCSDGSCELNCAVQFMECVEDCLNQH